MNNLGATTKRGREVGRPDLHMTACAVMSDGVDCLALTQLDSLSGLDFTLRITIGYELDGQRVPVPVIPMAHDMDRVKTIDRELHLDLAGVDLSQITELRDLPACIHQLLDIYYQYTGARVGMLSMSPGQGGKIFQSVIDE